MYGHHVEMDTVENDVQEVDVGDVFQRDGGDAFLEIVEDRAVHAVGATVMGLAHLPASGCGVRCAATSERPRPWHLVAAEMSDGSSCVQRSNLDAVERRVHQRLETGASQCLRGRSLPALTAGQRCVVCHPLMVRLRDADDRSQSFEERVALRLGLRHHSSTIQDSSNPAPEPDAATPTRPCGSAAKADVSTPSDEAMVQPAR